MISWLGKARSEVERSWYQSTAPFEQSLDHIIRGLIGITRECIYHDIAIQYAITLSARKWCNFIDTHEISLA